MREFDILVDLSAQNSKILQESHYRVRPLCDGLSTSYLCRYFDQHKLQHDL